MRNLYAEWQMALLQDFIRSLRHLKQEKRAPNGCTVTVAPLSPIHRQFIEQQRRYIEALARVRLVIA